MKCNIFKKLLFVPICIPFVMFVTLSNVSTYKNNISNISSTLKQSNNLTLDEVRNMNYQDIMKLSKFDGRELGIVTSAKDQGTEGICWAYALAAASETNMLYKQGVLDNNYNNQNFSLSANQIDKTVNIRNGNNDPLGLTNQDIINRNLGGGQGDTFLPAQLLLQQNSPIIAQPTGYTGPTAAWLKDVVKVPNNVIEIKKAIAKNGSVAFGYKGGGMGALTTCYYTTNTNFDHASVIVGWDDSIDRLRFGANLPNNNGAWIVKNSWGTNRHEEGFFYLSYESKIGSMCTLDYTNKSTYENVYYYDGLAGLEPMMTRQNKTAVIFPVKKASVQLKEKLKAVTFAIQGNNSTVNVKIYDNVNADPNNPGANDPTSGTLVHEQTSPVYDVAPRMDAVYTLDLNKEVELTPGTYFSVVLEVSNPSNNSQFLFSWEDSTNDLTYYYDKGSNHWNASIEEGYSLASKALTITEPRSPDEKNLSLSEIRPTKEQYEYTEAQIEPQVEVYYDGNMLVLNQDYLIDARKEMFNEAQANNVVGNLIVTITAKPNSNYVGHKSINLKIIKAPKPQINFGTYDPNNTISINVVDSIENKIKYYRDISLPTGWSFLNPNLELTNTDNKLIYNSSDKKYYVDTQFNANINKQKQKININNQEVVINANTNNYVYSGQPITPTITISYKSISLVINNDYSVSYSNNINAGTGQIIINGLDYLEGSKSVQFNIAKANNEITRFSIQNNQPIATARFGTVMFEYYSDQSGSTEINKPTIEGTYYVKAYVSGTSNYNYCESNQLLRWDFKKDNNGSQGNNTTIIIVISVSISLLLLIILITYLIIRKYRKNR